MYMYLRVCYSSLRSVPDACAQIHPVVSRLMEPIDGTGNAQV
jgi:hypothetical protein